MVAARPIVDWGLAEQVGTRLARRTPHGFELGTVQEQMDALAPLAESLVTDATGLRPNGPAQIRVVDRPAWVAANISAFRRLLAPLLERWEARMGNLSGVTMDLAGRVAAVELGSVLGWMSSRVLGQYDLLVAEQGDTGGDVVYLVGPNLVGLEQRFEFPEDQFRLWVLLHELTHRAQFTGVPWLASHFTALVHKALTLADPDLRQLRDAAWGMMRDRTEARRRLDEGGMLALMATPEQRATLAALGGMMALLEGHGDVTMNRAALGQVPLAPRFASVLKARRQAASPPLRLLRRLLGLETKLKQYEQGEEFIAAVEEAAGPRGIDVCWQSADRLPNLDEIREPQRWLDRVGLASATA
jgi:coenzyme F420 biosynthesis associated uncharacterized protein